MRFLVVGLGSIGRKHARNLLGLGHAVYGYDRNQKRADAVRREYAIEMFQDLRKALAVAYDGALICTPTSLHVPMALKLARRSVNIFIEKPLSNNLKGVKELGDIVRRKRLKALVACNARFLPSLRYAKDIIASGGIGKVLSVKAECGYYLPYWHPDSDYTSEYSAKRSLGGGVILDDIHELDSLRWLFGRVGEVQCMAGRVSNLRIDTEDVAEITLRFARGTIAQVHLDYLQRSYRRFYEFIGDKGTMLLDFITQRVRVYRDGSGRWTEKIFKKELDTKNEAMFIGELRHFINCIKGREKSVNDIKNAAATLKVALACHRSSRKKEAVFL